MSKINNAWVRGIGGVAAGIAYLTAANIDALRLGTELPESTKAAAERGKVTLNMSCASQAELSRNFQNFVDQQSKNPNTAITEEECADKVLARAVARVAKP